MERDQTPVRTTGPLPDVLGQLGALRRYARSLTRDDGEAEDLVHDALVHAYEKQSSFRPDKGVRNWLLSILHNTFIDRVRARRSRQRRIEQLTAEVHADPAGYQASPAQEHALRLAQVRQAFMSLPEEQRAVLHLVSIDGLSYAEAAQALGLPVGTVMSRLARARAALRAFEERPAAIPPATPANIVHLRIVGGSDDANG
ncbi:RNA polymerase sigma-70 factor (ECF subfamily) [Pseudochelatococcus lubricantis]|uniref:RNA polymerase sigma-70 factor (ECF subfamily) n=1 Tax=Pseudochelatococcus lubricantis TaxID=1538102 RepID=A0ABX0UZT3_9HYPH|nr:sigma-70 family RNA polymerase sigma factor [Pseudochelatococcus lubricantis]NIJ58473.1 RNA polymerase sigma-70 factor (ECF subfamily) [Pseudochelatococcus lubricantis]